MFFGVCLAGITPLSVQAQDEKKTEKKEEKKETPKSIFPDKNLEKAVRHSVFAKRYNEEPIVEEDVLKISTIKGRGLKIKNLTGLEKCRALASLELPENEIADIGALKGLKNIQLLDLANNKIADLTPIKEMIALQYINIEHNQVQSLEPLRGLERLAALYAADNQIGDISPVVKLPKLASLYLDDNKLTSVEGVNQIPWLTSLGLRRNQIRDIKPLVGLKNLTNFLFLEGNQISDFNPLIEMCKADLEGDKRFAPFVRIYLKGNKLDGEETKKQLETMKKMKLRVEDLGWDKKKKK